MTTLYYSKLFTSGPLESLVVHCQINGPSVDYFRGRFTLHSTGRDVITRDAWRIVDRSFQNYAR